MNASVDAIADIELISAFPETIVQASIRLSLSSTIPPDLHFPA